MPRSISAGARSRRGGSRYPRQGRRAGAFLARRRARDGHARHRAHHARFAAAERRLQLHARARRGGVGAGRGAVQTAHEPGPVPDAARSRSATGRRSAWTSRPRTRCARRISRRGRSSCSTKSRRPAARSAPACARRSRRGHRAAGGARRSSPRRAGATNGRALMPARLGPVVDRTRDAGGTIASVDYGHPVFELFSAPHSGDFSTAHVFRYRQLVAPGDSGVIARLDDGAPGARREDRRRRQGADVGVVARRILDRPARCSPCSSRSCTSSRSTPGRYGDARGLVPAGDVLDLSRHGELTAPFVSDRGRRCGLGTPLVLESPSGHRAAADGVGRASTWRRSSEEGFYELRGPGTAAGSGRPIAVNVDPKESDLSHFDPKELVAAVTATPGTAGRRIRRVRRHPPAGNADRRIWWYLLAVALC